MIIRDSACWSRGRDNTTSMLADERRDLHSKGTQMWQSIGSRHVCISSFPHTCRHVRAIHVPHLLSEPLPPRILPPGLSQQMQNAQTPEC